MSGLDPVAIFFIARESLGPWLWPLAGGSILLLAGIVAGASRLRRAGCPAGRPLRAAAVAGLVAAIGAVFVLPAWTGADIGAFAAFIDCAVAFLIALVPGAIVAALVFILAAFRCAARAPEAV